MVAAYAALVRLDPGPMVRLNHAAAVARADGPDAGLRLLEGIAGLDDHHLLHATRAELCRRAGDVDGARTSYDAALALDPSPAERRHLERRRATLGPDHLG